MPPHCFPSLCVSPSSSSVAILGLPHDADMSLTSCQGARTRQTGKQLKDVVGPELSTEATLNYSLLEGSPLFLPASECQNGGEGLTLPPQDEGGVPLRVLGRVSWAPEMTLGPYP